MENLSYRETYIHRRTQQLQQWDRVLGKLISRAENADNKNKTKLRHHIRDIRSKTKRIQVKLELLQKAEDERWDDIKSNLEIKWIELRGAFLNASKKSG